MFRIAIVVVIGAFLGMGFLAASRADESATPSPSVAPASPDAAPASTSAASGSPTAEQEKGFAELLSGATLEGTWQMTTFEEGKEPVLGEARADRYTIEKAEKVVEDQWMVTARVQYADKDVSLPVPVRVKWAGDTPVITLDTLNMPMLGTYSARVMFHKGFYSGVWYGANYGGVMSGRVVKAKEG